MATFAISVTIQVDADSYEEAYEIENTLTQELEANQIVMGVYSIDVEQIDGHDDDADE